MELFNSYASGNAFFCDITEPCVYPDPNARILCLELETTCGVCNGLIATNEFVLCDCNDSWNCNLCGNSLPFWIPYTDDDTFDFQFQQPNKITEVSCEHGWLPHNLVSPTNGTFASFEIRTCCDDEPLIIDEEMFEAIVQEHYVGTYNQTDYSGNVTINQIQAIRFNMRSIRLYLEDQGLETCFYFVFRFVAGRNCLGNTEDINEYCSEPFKNVVCNADTAYQVAESIYPKKDCFSYYYGLDYNIGQGTPFQYSNRIRIPGFFEQTSFTITKEVISTTLKTTMSQNSEMWQLKTTHLPQTFVKYLVNVFSGKNVFINGEEYQVQGEINRNNDSGLQWYLDVNFEKIDCNKSLTCE
jgi:hypothetical protein